MTTLAITTLSIKTLGIMAFGKTTLSITAYSNTTLIITLYNILLINITRHYQHNNLHNKDTRRNNIQHINKYNMTFRVTTFSLMTLSRTINVTYTQSEREKERD